MWMFQSKNLRRLILLCDSARWQATSAYPCTALIQTGISLQIFKSRLNCILTKCIFRLPNLVSENKWCGPKSIERSSGRENLESTSYDNTATKSAMNCQRKATLQSSAIESKHNHFNSSALQFLATACMHPSFLCPPWHDVSLCIHSIVEYSFQSQYLF
jgi:hypothetical protein